MATLYILEQKYLIRNMFDSHPYLLDTVMTEHRSLHVLCASVELLSNRRVQRIKLVTQHHDRVVNHICATDRRTRLVKVDLFLNNRNY